MTEHPITPPPELVQQWINEEQGVFAEHIATQAARWGADQELDACCEWLQVWFWQHEDLPKRLRATRRPKPPSLKEQAIETLHMIRDHLPADMYDKTFLIRSALESLPD